MNSNELELYHSGVLGMKWGVRNDETKARYARARVKASNKLSKNKEKIDKLRSKNKELVRKKTIRDAKLSKSNYKIAKAKARAARRFFRTDITDAKFNRLQRKNSRLEYKSTKIDRLIQKNKKKIIKLNKKNDKIKKTISKYSNTSLKDVTPNAQKIDVSKYDMLKDIKYDDMGRITSWTIKGGKIEDFDRAFDQNEKLINELVKANQAKKIIIG